jgi:hypothetical protein
LERSTSWDSAPFFAYNQLESAEVVHCGHDQHLLICQNITQSCEEQQQSTSPIDSEGPSNR